jgi:glutaminyl-tRNA synthetase
VPAEVRIYNELFTRQDPNAADIAVDLNPRSLELLRDAQVEPALAMAASGEPVQFERQGYFVRDSASAPDRLVFNRTIGLRDTWAKVAASS